MIPHIRHMVPLRLNLDMNPPVEIAFATHTPSLPSTTTAPCIHADVGRYRLRLAKSAEDREAACRLRFKVFNIELGEGLESSYETGLDTDRFDAVCEHLLVEDKLNRKVVGTYRMQSGKRRRRAIRAITPSRSSTWRLTSRSGQAFWNWAGHRSTASTARQRC